MNHSALIYCLVILAVLSSGCAALNSFTSSPDTQTIVEEGNTLVYEDPEGERTDIVLFNETEQQIGLHLAAENPSTVKINKENWASEDGPGSELFFSGLLSNVNQSKFDSLMEEGQDISTSETELSRSDQVRWKNFQAYNISLGTGEDKVNLMVHAERPYLILKSPALELVSVNETESLDQYSIGEQEQTLTESQEELQRVRNTDLDISTVSRNSQEDSDQMRLHIRNTGEVTVNVTDFTVRYGPPNWEPIRFGVLQSQSSWTVADHNCFTEDRELRPSQVYTCDTGIKYPGAEQEVEVNVLSESFDFETSYICSPTTEGSRTC